jgi:hypothetical protein
MLRTAVARKAHGVGVSFDPSIPVQLTKIGALKDGEPDRDWFAASCARSIVAIEFAKAEADRELALILAGDA